jgi:ribosome recycling factor
MTDEYKTSEAQRRAVAKYDKEHIEEARLRKREWARKNKDTIKRNNQNNYAKIQETKKNQTLFKELPVGVC